MKKNIGNFERGVRVLGGGALLSLAFWGPRQRRYLLFSIPVVEGLIGTCALYSALGISTRPTEEDQANAYFPVQSPSERAAGHPIVGVS